MYNVDGGIEYLTEIHGRHDELPDAIAGAISCIGNNIRQMITDKAIVLISNDDRAFCCITRTDAKELTEKEKGLAGTVGEVPFKC